MHCSPTREKIERAKMNEKKKKLRKREREPNRGRDTTGDVRAMGANPRG